MSRKLSQLTTAQLKEEMSIAGNPDKLMAMFEDIHTITGKVDTTNPAELINLELVLQRHLAEVRRLKRMYEKQTNQKIQ